jgi:hypothetical protein
VRGGPSGIFRAFPTAVSAVLLVFADCGRGGKRAEGPAKPDHVSPDVALQGLTAFKRVCLTCCDPDECVMADPETAALESLPCPLFHTDARVPQPL